MHNISEYKSLFFKRKPPKYIVEVFDEHTKTTIYQQIMRYVGVQIYTKK
jgi:hypothetical protein